MKKVYRLKNRITGEFVQGTTRSIWFNVGGIKNAINYSMKRFGSNPYKDCDIIEYELIFTDKIIPIEDIEKK